MLCLPSPHLGRGIYIDENALQPGQVSALYKLKFSMSGRSLQVNTYWSWQDVHTADVYLAHMEELRNRNASSIE